MDKISKTDFMTIMAGINIAKSVHPVLLDTLCLIGITRSDESKYTISIRLKNMEVARSFYNDLIRILERRSEHAKNEQEDEDPT